MRLPRILSLRNLVLGYGWGKVFPADVGLHSPDSPSREAASWLSSRFSPSVEMRWQFGWLGMVFIRCASSELFCAVREVLMVARERRGALLLRKAPLWRSSTIARAAACAVGTVLRVRAARSSMSRESVEPLCMRIKGANRFVSEEKAAL